MAIENTPDEHNVHIAGMRDAIQDLRWHSEKAYPVSSVYGRQVQDFINAIVAFFARLAD